MSWRDSSSETETRLERDACPEGLEVFTYNDRKGRMSMLWRQPKKGIFLKQVPAKRSPFMFGWSTLLPRPLVDADGIRLV